MATQLSNLLRTVWFSQGGDFQVHHDYFTTPGLENYVYWLITNAKKVFPAIEGEIVRDVFECMHVIDTYYGHVQSTTLLNSILKFRTDLVEIHSKEIPRDDQILKAWNWFLFGGYSDYNLPHGLPHIFGLCNDNIIEYRDEKLHAVVPQIARFLYDLLAPAKCSANNTNKVFSWFYSEGIRAIGRGNPLGKKLLEIMTQPPKRGGNDFGNQPPWAFWLYDCTIIACDDKSAFASDADLQAVAAWWECTGKTLYAATNELFERLTQESKNEQNSEYLTLVPDKLLSVCAHDICLVGYPKGEFGLGEDIRLVRSSFETAGISARSYRVPGFSVARENANEDCLDISALPQSSKLLFYVMPAFDTFALYGRYGKSAFPRGYKVGFWQWELESLPEEVAFAFSLVDVVWCHSRHSEGAFKLHSDKPIYRVPLPVKVPQTVAIDRAKLGVPDGNFVFFTSFDGASYISRKNPLAVIEAFQCAFPKSDRSVSLVIKIMNQQMCSLWRECLSRISSDSRIVVIDRVMDRNDYYGMLRSCDAVVSLHRAEGFGRLMAEAMACGIPTIASEYSGNLDFMDTSNSLLVPGELVPLFQGDYPCLQGQRWFNADINEAASKMKKCREDVQLCQTIAINGKKKIEEQYSLDACGRVYQELLKGIL